MNAKNKMNIISDMILYALICKSMFNVPPCGKDQKLLDQSMTLKFQFQGSSACAGDVTSVHCFCFHAAHLGKIHSFINIPPRKYLEEYCIYGLCKSFQSGH
jgi:hypothetical protein